MIYIAVIAWVALSSASFAPIARFGYATEYPEHTIHAYRAAAKNGVGTSVVCLWPTHGTTHHVAAHFNDLAKGLSDGSGLISETNYSVIKQLNAAYNFINPATIPLSNNSDCHLDDNCYYPYRCTEPDTSECYALRFATAQDIFRRSFFTGLYIDMKADKATGDSNTRASVLYTAWLEADRSRDLSNLPVVMGSEDRRMNFALRLQFDTWPNIEFFMDIVTASQYIQRALFNVARLVPSSTSEEFIAELASAWHIAVLDERGLLIPFPSIQHHEHLYIPTVMMVAFTSQLAQQMSISTTSAFKAILRVLPPTFFDIDYQLSDSDDYPLICRVLFNTTCTSVTDVIGKLAFEGQATAISYSDIKVMQSARPRDPFLL